MVTDEFDRPRRVASMQLAEVQGGHGERRERGGPQGARRAWSTARDRDEGNDQRDERVRQEPHAEWRGHWPVVRSCVEVQNSRNRAHPICGRNQRSVRVVMPLMTV